MVKKIAIAAGGLVALLLLYILVWTGSPMEVAGVDDYRKYEGTIDWDAVTAEATPLLQEFIRIKTIRADEHKASLWLQARLKKEGIASRIYAHPDDPSRSNLVAEIIPDNPDPDGGMILSSHTDVVEVNEEKWERV